MSGNFCGGNVQLRVTVKLFNKFYSVSTSYSMVILPWTDYLNQHQHQPWRSRMSLRTVFILIYRTFRLRQWWKSSMTPDTLRTTEYNCLQERRKRRNATDIYIRNRDGCVTRAIHLSPTLRHASDSQHICSGTSSETAWDAIQIYQNCLHMHTHPHFPERWSYPVGVRMYLHSHCEVPHRHIHSAFHIEHRECARTRIHTRPFEVTHLITLIGDFQSHLSNPKSAGHTLLSPLPRDVL